MIYSNANPFRLAWLRVAVFAIWGTELALEPLARISELPATLLQRHGPWTLFPVSTVSVLLESSNLAMFKCGLLLLIALALVGIRPARAWAVSAAVGLTLHEALVRGLGYANHAQLPLLYVTYVLCCSPAWDAVSLQPARTSVRAGSSYAAAFLAASIAFSFPYFIVAVHRIVGEGALLYFGDTVVGFVARHTVRPGHYNFRNGSFLLEHLDWTRPLLNVGFALTTLAELSAPWACFSRLRAQLLVAVLIPFHVAALLFMNIAFMHNLLLIVLFYAWPMTWNTSLQVAASTGRRVDPGE